MGIVSDPSVSSGNRGKLSSRPTVRAFTILELLIASVVFVIIVGVVLNFTDQTSKIWRSATAKIQAFQEARAGFDAMTRSLSQAMLNPYFDYYNSANVSRSSLKTKNDLANFEPSKYDRMSDLHFISGQAETLLGGVTPSIKTQTQAVFFQAPKGYAVENNLQGLDTALNACGYFLQFDDGANAVPDFISSSPSFQKRYRFRMMEMTQGTENLGVYDSTGGANAWFRDTATVAGSPTQTPNSRVIAENVIALVILPKLPDRLDDPAGTTKGVALAPNYNYNSRVPLQAGSDPAWAGATPPFPGDAFSSVDEDNVSHNMTRHHQLPPVVRVVMVVIDEASAARLQGSSTSAPSAIDLSGKGLFEDATKLSQDIQKIEDVCNAKPGNLTGNTQKLNYRVFSTDIIMRQAKWSNK
jgi:uncharacterized protein (TIGR02599 family)